MIKLKNVSKAFEEKILFDKFNLDIKDGELVFITGPSGCGKSTLLSMIGGLEPIDSGELFVGEYAIHSKYNSKKYYKDMVGFLFQNFALLENKTARENLEIIKKSGRSGMTAEEALKRVGLLEASEKKVYKLSGGEQQRLALARLMMKKCDIILADEPTGSLDSKNGKMVMNILHELNKERKTVVVVTHSSEVLQGGGRVVKI